MYLIAPDVLAEARGLSIGVSATGVALGLLLWLFGWRWHRFWTVGGVTLAAGLFGLAAAPAAGGQVIAIGLLLAVAAGLLALELARIVAFLAGGSVVWLAAAAIFPNVREPAIFFLAGGLVGLLFYRLWTMALTSYLGVLLATHAGINLAETLGAINASAFATEHSVPLSVGVALLTAVGLAAQGAQERRRLERDDPRRIDLSRSRRRWRRRRPFTGDELPPDLVALRETFRKPAT